MVVKLPGNEISGSVITGNYQANEGDWVQCKSVAHFTTAPRFIDVHVIRTLSCYLIRAAEAKYLLGRAQHVFGTQKMVHKTGFGPTRKAPV